MEDILIGLKDLGCNVDIYDPVIKIIHNNLVDNPFNGYQRNMILLLLLWLIMNLIIIQ